MAPPLATPADLETYAELGMDLARAEFFLDAASAAVRAYCGWHIAPSETGDLQPTGPDSWLLMLPTLALTAVSTITVDGEVITDEVAFSRSGYLWTTSVDSPRTWKPWQTVVAATHGHATVPPELVALTTGVAARAAVSPTGAVREQTGPFSVAYAQASTGTSGGVVLVDAERMILDRYRLPPRP